MLKIVIADSYDQVSEEAFKIMRQVVEKENPVLGLATGSTPVGLYKKMIADHKTNGTSYKNAITFNLDEYVGLAPTDEHSYAYFMNEYLFNAKPFKHSYLPDGIAKDVDAEVERYERVLQENPVDLQLLGIGSNGHIGFNEPGTPFTQRTHKVHLTESTIEANKRFFEKEEDVPRYAYSMGLQSIMDAKEIVLIAFGPKKVHAIKGLVEGPITEEVPASILQNHPKVTVICDEAAAELLTK